MRERRLRRLLSQRVMACLDDGFRTESAGELVLKGFHRPVPAYRLLAPDRG